MPVATELSQSRELLVNLTLRELRGRYKRSLLGWTWSLLNPLATMAIFSVVFGVFLRVEIPAGNPSGLLNFPAFLLCGLLPWSFVAAGINGSMLALLGNAGLIKKVWFPRQVLVVSSVLALVVAFLIEMGVLAVFLVVLGNMVLPWLVPTVVLMAVLAVFVTGIGLIVSVVNVYFRDLQHLVSIGLQFWFYATPIVYPVTLVPEQHTVGPWTLPVRAIYSLNPMVDFVAAFRALLYDMRIPSVGELAYLGAWSIGVLVVGVLVFRRFEPRLAEEL